ncbi:uncharacterized protein BO80DRAFT_276246 [Aspergillus ibericus CBS 121593]|uniref:Uncharacterized protein n=1 Tax=Aspergillus ibericus CBS 121593 TaxID=1448316 RepID=A0A395GIF8_9EURO|nr:hypothetical protein BO80DRAFT_276246 [Aspergillus ibericus CBS 121593]RAK95219.1 hypothetical protein BO80DRAFT_276246 [Aspergillus ibericus CBS 121593]
MTAPIYLSIYCANTTWCCPPGYLGQSGPISARPATPCLFRAYFPAPLATCPTRNEYDAPSPRSRAESLLFPPVCPPSAILELFQSCLFLVTSRSCAIS